MKKILRNIALAVALGCGLVVTSLPAGYWSTSWNSSQSSWLLTEVNVPSACSVSINVYAGGWEAFVWGVVWGSTNGFNKGEYRGTNGSGPDSWNYGSSTADLYYVEVSSQVWGSGYGAVDFAISW